MNKVRWTGTWVLGKCLVCWCAFEALVRTNLGAGNILKFLVVFSFVLSVLAVVAKKECRNHIKKGPPVPNSVELLYSLAFAVFLAYYGWFWLAALSITASLLQIGFYSEGSSDDN